jgi:micrococcal nuclease
VEQNDKKKTVIKPIQEEVAQEEIDGNLAKVGYGHTIAPQKYYRVKKVVDGDTYWIDDGTKSGIKIRMLGVDAPESKNRWKNKKEPYGKEASVFMKYLILEEKIRLKIDVTRYGRYNKTLAYGFLKDGTNINVELVKNGFATLYTAPPNVKYVDDFVFALQFAKKTNMESGLINQGY